MLAGVVDDDTQPASGATNFIILAVLLLNWPASFYTEYYLAHPLCPLGSQFESTAAAHFKNNRRCWNSMENVYQPCSDGSHAVMLSFKYI